MPRVVVNRRTRLIMDVRPRKRIVMAKLTLMALFLTSLLCGCNVVHVDGPGGEAVKPEALHQFVGAWDPVNEGDGPPARTYSHDSPQPGSRGSIQIGFSVDEPLDDVIQGPPVARGGLPRPDHR